MIASVRGTVTSVGVSSAVVEVAGIGLLVQCTPHTLADWRVGDVVSVPTSLVVREDSLTLFGFATDDERHLFEVLQTASGVGPKVAQAALAVLSPDELRSAIVSDNPKALTQVPGVGLKGAQRIILELKDRLTKAGVVAAPSPASSGAGAWQGQVLAGLTSLGWSTREAEAAVAAVADQAGPTPQVAELLRAALQTLSRT